MRDGSHSLLDRLWGSSWSHRLAALGGGILFVMAYRYGAAIGQIVEEVPQREGLGSFVVIRPRFSRVEALFLAALAAAFLGKSCSRGVILVACLWVPCSLWNEVINPDSIDQVRLGFSEWVTRRVWSTALAITAGVVVARGSVAVLRRVIHGMRRVRDRRPAQRPR